MATMATAEAAGVKRRHSLEQQADSVVSEECVRDLLAFFSTRSSGYRARHVDRRVSCWTD